MSAKAGFMHIVGDSTFYSIELDQKFTWRGNDGTKGEFAFSVLDARRVEGDMSPSPKQEHIYVRLSKQFVDTLIQKIQETRDSE